LKIFFGLKIYYLLITSANLWQTEVSKITEVLQVYKLEF